MKKVLVVVLLAVVGLGAAVLITSPSFAGKPCGPAGCPKGQFCILGECVKQIPCEIVLCAVCPEGYVLSPTPSDCCRCVPEDPKGGK